MLDLEFGQLGLTFLAQVFYMRRVQNIGVCFHLDDVDSKKSHPNAHFLQPAIPSDADELLGWRVPQKNHVLPPPG